MPRIASIDNWVVIRVWHGKKNEVGHVSLQTPMHYISLWPRGAVSLLDVMDLNDTKPAKYHSLRDDIEAEHGAPDTVVCLYCLNVDEIEYRIEKVLHQSVKEWALSGKIKSRHYFNYFSDENKEIASGGPTLHSCASIVNELLIYGEVQEILPYLRPEDKHYASIRATLSNSLVAASAATVGTLVAMPAGLIGAPSVWIGQKFGNEKLENFGYDVIGKPYTAAAALTGMAVAHAMTMPSSQSSGDDDFVLPEAFHDLENSPLLANPKYQNAIHGIRHPAHALTVNFITPGDVERIALLAKLYETVKYPETLNFPNQNEQLATLPKVNESADFLPVVSHQLSNILFSLFAPTSKNRSNHLTELQNAVMSGDLSKVSQLWKEHSRDRMRKTGMRRDKIDPGRRSLLHLAVLSKSMDVLKFLLVQKFYDVDNGDRYYKTPLMLTCEVDGKEQFLLLLKNSADVTRTDRDGKNIFHHTLTLKKVDFAFFLLANKPELLHSLDGHGKNILFYCVCNENLHREIIVDFLMARTSSEGENQAHPDIELPNNIFGTLIAQPDNYGRTILFELVKRNDADKLEWFLSKGADISHRDKNLNTLLHVAIQSKSVECIKFLLDKGADINLKNDNDKKPYDMAYDSFQPELKQIYRDYNLSTGGLMSWFK